jgi:aspartate racemase
LQLSAPILGLVGGISWVSTLDYYRLINEGVNHRLGGLHSARLIVHSLDFHEFVANNTAARWDLTLELMRGACRSLVDAGASAIMLCANTAHAVIAPLKAEFDVEFIDIIDETAAAVMSAGISKAALLGTQFTMELPFYREGMARHHIEVRVPASQSQRDYIQATVRDELGRGIVLEKTRDVYRDIVRELLADGCEGVIFGCTEIPLLLKPSDFPVPCFDTTQIHASAGVRFLLGVESGKDSTRAPSLKG